jgi:hypothetical protein
MSLPLRLLVAAYFLAHAFIHTGFVSPRSPETPGALFRTEGSAIDWFVARFDELRSAGPPDAIPALGGSRHS